MSRSAAVSGSNGFIGSNLSLRLRELGIGVVPIARGATVEEMTSVLSGVDLLYHCAGVNRTLDARDFEEGNLGMTQRLCAALKNAGTRAGIVYTSSTQATLENAYGSSKRACEDAIFAHSQATGAPCRTYRLPNVFGKWSRPDYNSVVATFCDRISRGEAFQVHDAAAQLNLVYIDDVIREFAGLLHEPWSGASFGSVEPVYATTVGELANILRQFKKSRQTLLPGCVGLGLHRALYATYLSFQRPDAFAYNLKVHRDQRGVFAEMLRTEGFGQFSFFTALPGVTRGGHYHHSKNEKFLVVQGSARFRFRHILSQQQFAIDTNGVTPSIVESVPGWIHDVTNMGDDVLIVMLWANENFDPENPDTHMAKV